MKVSKNFNNKKSSPKLISEKEIENWQWKSDLGILTTLGKLIEVKLKIEIFLAEIYSLQVKGQLISECPFGDFKSTKKPSWIL